MPTHQPAGLQTSANVQLTPSSQFEPMLRGVTSQPPSPTHTLVAAHWLGVQAYGAPVHTPLTHRSLEVQS